MFEGNASLLPGCVVGSLPLRLPLLPPLLLPLPSSLHLTADSPGMPDHAIPNEPTSGMRSQDCPPPAVN